MSTLKQKTLPLLLSIAFSLYALPLHANTDTMMCHESFKDNYSFELSDANQKKVAIGMIAWGIILATASLLLSGFIPNSTDPDATAGTPADNGSLF